MKATIKFPQGSSLSRSLLMRGSLLRLWIRRKQHLILYVLESNLSRQRKTVSVLQRGVFERGNPLVFVYRLFVFLCVCFIAVTRFRLWQFLPWPNCSLAQCTFWLVVQMGVGNLIQIRTRTGFLKFRHDRYNCLPVPHGVSGLVQHGHSAALAKAT